MRIARKANDPWNGIDWKLEVPSAANPLDTIESKRRIVAERMPAKYEQILIFLADGMSPQLISEYVGVDADVIRRIRQLQPQTIAKINEAILDNLIEANQVMSERLAREAKDLPTVRLPQALAATIDKAQLLSGGVTQRTETKRVVTPEELQQLFESLPRAKVIEDKKDANSD